MCRSNRSVWKLLEQLGEAFFLQTKILLKPYHNQVVLTARNSLTSCLIPFIHHTWKIFWAKSCVRTKLSPNWSTNTSAAMCRNPPENVAYEFVLCFSGSSLHVWFVLLGWFMRWEVGSSITAVLPGVTQDSTQHSCVVPINFFSRCVFLVFIWRIHIVA